MDEEAREARRAYLRQWKHDHKDRIREYNARYWKKKSSRAKESAVEEDHPE